MFKKTSINLVMIAAVTLVGFGFFIPRARAMVPPPASRVFLFLTATPTPVPLSGTLTANPASGVAPLDSQLTGTVSNGSGSVNYTFWYNCPVQTNSVAAASEAQNCGSPYTNGEKHDGINATSYSTNHSFQTAGVYHLKLIIERGEATPIDLHTDVSVSPPVTYGFNITSLTADPSSGVQPLNPNLTINYIADHAGPWDVYIYCKDTNPAADHVYLNQPDANITSAPGHAPPWFGASLDLSSTCSYTGLNFGNITLKVVMKNSASPSTTDSATVGLNVVGPQTPVALTASLSADPNPATINRPVSFTAVVAGGTTENFNYSFYCRDTDAAPTATFNNVASKTQTAPDICTYSSVGSYKPKVVVTQQGSSATGTTQLSVGNPSLSVTLQANPSSLTINQKTDLEAVVSGSARGNIQYDFYCLSSNATYDRRVTSASTTYQAGNLCSYSSAGTVLAKVIVTREGMNASATAAITVSSSGANGQIIFEEGGNPIVIKGSLVANQVVLSARSRGTSQFGVRIYSDKSVLASNLPGFSDIMSIIVRN